MKNCLLTLSFFFLSFSQFITAQNCIYFDPVTPDFPIMCFTDPSTMDGDEITLTAAQFDDDAFIMSLIQTDFIDGAGFAGGLTVDCDVNASVSIIRVRRLTNKGTATARNSGNLSEITFETSSVVGVCNNQTLSLNVRIIEDSIIPTFSEWGLFLFGLLLLNLCGVLIQKNSMVLD